MTGDIACGTGLLCTGNIISVTGSPVSSITVGITSILGGSTGNIIYNNAGIVGEYALATALDYLAGTANNKIVTPSIIWPSETTTTYGATINLNFQTFKNTSITLTGSITTMNVTNVVAGKAGMITFIQDGFGSHSTVFNNIFKFTSGIAPTLTATGGAVDILSYSCRTTTFCAASMLNDVR